MTRTESPPTPAEAAADTTDERAVCDRRADQWEQRLAVPVIVAAAVSIPAVFLTMMDAQPLQLAGHTLNWVSLVVLAGETLLLMVLSGDKLAWLERHKWKLAITAVAVPAVVFAVAPVQALRLLRLVRLIGTLRILRANTIVNAGRTIARRFGLTGFWRLAPVLAAALLAAGFVGLVLVDPTAARQHQELAEEVSGWRSAWRGPLPVLLAGAILAAATFIVVRYRRRGQPPPES